MPTIGDQQIAKRLRSDAPADAAHGPVAKRHEGASIEGTAERAGYFLCPGRGRRLVANENVTCQPGLRIAVAIVSRPARAAEAAARPAFVPQAADIVAPVNVLGGVHG